MTRSSLSRPAIAGAGLVVLLAVVALASSGRGPGAPDGGGRDFGSGWLDAVFTLALVGMLITIVALVLGMRLKREDDSTFDLRLMLLVGVVAVAFFAAIAYGASLLASDEPGQRVPPASGIGTGGGGGSTQAPQTIPVAEARDTHLSWPVLAVVVLAGVALFAATVGRSWWRRARQRRREEEAVEALRTVIREALEDLESGDPRRAVIAAYAGMERTFALHGLPRRAAEAPLEYTARVLTDLHASPASVAALTALFERARFSAHEIGEDDRAEAVRALGAVRDELGEGA